MCFSHTQKGAQEGATAQTPFWAVLAPVSDTVDHCLHQKATVGIIWITWQGAYCLEASLIYELSVPLGTL